MKILPSIRSVALIAIGVAAFAQSESFAKGKPQPPPPPPSSPANPEIAFITSSSGGLSSYNLVVANRDGSHTTILYSSSKLVKNAEFCPTGEKWILFRESLEFGQNALRRVHYENSGSGVWPVGEVETIEAGYNVKNLDVSPDGQWVIFNDFDGSLWLKSLSNLSDPARHVFGGSNLESANAVWLQTPNRLAVSFRDLLEPNGWEVMVFAVDPLADPVWSGEIAQGPITGSPEAALNPPIESARSHDGVIFYLRTEVGQTVSKKGTVSILYEDIVSEWNLTNLNFGPVGTSGITGREPCYSPDDEFVLTAVGGEIRMNQVSDGTSSVFAQGSGFDWKPSSIEP